MCQVYFFSPLLRQLLEKLILCFILYLLISELTLVHVHVCFVLFCFVKHKASALPRNLLHFAFLLLNIVFKEIL